jgi:hypothetical protein
MIFLNYIISLLFKKPTKTTTTTTKKIDITTTTTTKGDNKMKLALCCGINKYPNPENNLAGCVNDCLDLSNLLTNSYGFEVKALIDNNYTRNNFIKSIESLLERNPDVLVITNSSHGTRFVDNSGFETDGYCEALCLYDGLIVDHDFKAILAKANPKTSIVVFSDSCHSTGVTRNFLRTMNDFDYVSVPKYLPPEDDMEAISVSMAPISKAIFEPNEKMNEVLLAGCKSDQYSYDASFGKRPNGAFTYYTIKILSKNPSITYEDFIKEMNKYLPSGRYPQCPVCETNENMKKKVIFS